MTTPFDTVVAIDWSGAKTPARRIQVAECSPGNDSVRLVPPDDGRWKRERVWGWLQQLFQKHVALVGFDFAFAYPFCEVQAYFPGHPETPLDARGLWDTVEAVCGSAPDFYGGPFYRDPKAPFVEYFHTPGHTGSRYDGKRFRATESACKEQGTSPASVFNCVGPKQVGPGSVAGFRLLRQIAQEATVTIWPFCGAATSGLSVVVEIFPAVFLQRGGANQNGLSERMVERALRKYDVSLLDHTAWGNFSEDERDALVSAAGLRRLSEDPSFWKPAGMSECHAAYEGWIFGVR